MLKGGLHFEVLYYFLCGLGKKKEKKKRKEKAFRHILIFFPKTGGKKSK